MNNNNNNTNNNNNNNNNSNNNSNNNNNILWMRYNTGTITIGYTMDVRQGSIPSTGKWGHCANSLTTSAIRGANIQYLFPTVGQCSLHHCIFHS